jgi:FlaA1/EpsC-like NDP-sugar epimerase
MHSLGLYRIHFRRVGVWSVWRAVSAVAAGAAVVLLVDTLLLRVPLGTATGLLFVYLTLTGSLVPRASYAFMAEAYARRPLRGRPALICGTGRAAISFLHRTLGKDGLDLRPVGFLDDAPELAGKMIHGVPVYAMAGGEISGLLRSLGAQVVVLVGDGASDAREARLYLSVQSAGGTLLRFRESVAEVVPVRTPRNTDDPEGADSHLEDLRSG